MQLSSEHAFSGTHSVKITGAGGGYNANYLIHDLTSVPELQEKMFGRMMIRLSSENSQGGDFTFIQADGGPRAASGAPAGTSVMYRGRLDGRNDHFMANYDTWLDNGSGSTAWLTDCWAHPNNISSPPQEYVIPKDQWACVQWEFDADANSLKFWLNDNELSQIQVINQGDGCIDSSTQNNVWWGPQSFTNLRLGIEQYHGNARPRTMYIDDIAIDDRYVSCPDSSPPVTSSSSSLSSSSISSSASSVSSAVSSSPSSSPSTGGEVNDLTAYFAQYSCGVNYTALGNGGYNACFRLEDGTAACTVKDQPATVEPVRWSSGEVITGVRSVSGAGGSSEAIVVTDNGAVYHGRFNSVNPTPVIESGGVYGSGGYNARCVMTKENGSKGIQCWRDGSAPSAPGLPAGFEVQQLSAAYGLACALNSQGEVWCWLAGGNVGSTLGNLLSETPAKMPFAEPMVQVAAGQTSICGIKHGGGVDCIAGWHDGFFLPGRNDGAGGFELATQYTHDVVAFQSGWLQGIGVRADGTAFYSPGQFGAPASNDSQFVAFSGVSSAVSAGGDRLDSGGAACVLDARGDVFCLDGGSTVRVTGPVKAAAGSCPQ